MAILWFAAIPSVLVNLAAFGVFRRRASWLHMAFRAAVASIACILTCGCVLLPLERITFYATNGFLGVEFSRSAQLLCMLLPAAIGVFMGLCVKEDVLEERARKEETSVGRTLRKIQQIIAHVLLLLLLFLSQAYIWGKMTYPNTSLDEIMYYIRIPMKGVNDSFADSIIHSVILPTAFFFAAIAGAILPGMRRIRIGFSKKRMHPVYIPIWLTCAAIAVWSGVLWVCGDRLLDIRSYFVSYFEASTFIEEEYIDPRTVNITFPKKKRNLITIYVESGETTPQDIENGGVLSENLIPEMTRIAKENISFSRSEKIQGASIPPGCGWTIAGLVAQSSGLPLKLNIQDETTMKVVLPGAETMGEILRENGYRTVFMAGSDFGFGARREYYQAHGDYEIWDLFTAREMGRIPKDYKVFWGFEDLKLYEYAKERLLELQAEDQPFHFALLTVDTHAPGYRCEACPVDHINTGRDSDHYADVLRCSSIQLDEFLKWCSQQAFYDETTIVITGDHASQQDYFYNPVLGEAYHRDTGDNNRLVYNAFINAIPQAHQQKNRLFTTLDFFPTTLAAMGVKIEGERLGLGVNLFSQEPTLAEVYGEEYMFNEMLKRSVFYQDELLYP